MTAAPTALVADLVASRKLVERKAFSERLERVLARLNEQWAGEWLAPLVTTRGLDEISAALVRPRHAFDVVVGLNQAIWPRRFRMAVADGEIDVAAASGDAAAMDGPAFHAAAAALRRAADEGTTFTIALRHMPPAAARLVEAAARLHGILMASWKPSRARASESFLRHGVQAEVAEELDISPQSVSEALRAAHTRDLIEVQEAIRGWFRHVEESEPFPDSESLTQE